MHKSQKTGGRSLWNKDDKAYQSNITVPLHLAYCGVAAALRHHAVVETSNLAVLCVELPDAIDTYVHAGQLFLRQILGQRGYIEPFVRAIKRIKNDKLTELEILRRAAQNGKSILLCANLDDVDEEVRLFADVVTTIPKPTTRQITATFRRYGHVLTKSDEEMIASEAWARLLYAFPPGRPVKAGLRRLRETSDRALVSKEACIATGPTLTDLSGMGPAKDWGLELARDIIDFKAGAILWDDVDTGALISGPPGTGKTLFAEALARSCGLPIVATSAAQWQATGYLNDLLKAMRECFREAQSKGTALLFIDELDAIGSRAINDSQHGDYKRQVINALLEILDGFERRTGVVVIGATNNPQNIDTALLRPGRLDRHFQIPLPDATERQRIFEFHAGFLIPRSHEEMFARTTAGMSGAGLKQLVRDGRRAARRRNQRFGFEHVSEAAKALIDLPIQYMKVAAVHEAGHAIIGIELGLPFQGVRITDKICAEGVDSLGGTLFNFSAMSLRTKSLILDQIAMYMGGIAAETLIFGEFTEGSGEHPLSDLGLATALATKLEGCFGMGGSLVIDIVHERDLHKLRANDYRLRAAVGAILDTEFDRAKEILDTRKDALLAIAEDLVKSHVMSVADVREALTRHSAKE
ncbi:AAA family ATPase [Hoeflea sp. EC-HK425]|uniref:AAA family ATPase n=1 Tax=Hoeflea sp. EC-HK425 TaxID=2038388 RepID=UPI00125F5B56|nr:AAA family ATPase [Hoeflea sp. EC-HK425]